MSDLSDLEDEQGASQHSAPGGPYDPKRHAREQHNALERRRRDNIKDMYTSLREVVPDAGGERVQASRAVILRKAIETIEKGQSFMGAWRCMESNDSSLRIPIGQQVLRGRPNGKCAPRLCNGSAKDFFTFINSL